MPPSPCGDDQKREGGGEVAVVRPLEDCWVERRVADPRLEQATKKSVAKQARDSKWPRAPRPRRPTRPGAAGAPAVVSASSTPKSGATAGRRPPRCGTTSRPALSRSSP